MCIIMWSLATPPHHFTVHHLIDSKSSFNFSCCFNNFEFSLRSDSNSLVRDSLSEISFFRLLSFSLKKGFESIIFSDRKKLTSTCKSTSFVSAVVEHLVEATLASDPTLSHSFLSPSENQTRWQPL